MYRYVHIQDSATLRSLDEKISDLSKAQGKDIWRWVRTFFADEPLSSEEMMAIITKTVNLIEVYTRMFVSPELLVALRQCCPSLRSLEIWVGDESHEAMVQVGLFENVKHLSISRRFGRRNRPPLSNPMDRWADAPSWNMPAVTHFSWHDQLLHLAAFVSRCWFPHLQHLELSFVNLEGNLEGTTNICRFLDAHPHIRSIRIKVLHGENMSIIPSVRAQNLQLCHIPLDYPPQAWVPLLRPEVKTLELELSASLVYVLGANLWELLTQFAAEGDTPPTLEKIHLRSVENIYDNDDPGITTVQGFSRTLLSHIRPLKARGICVFVDHREICV
jgi:hypothetical protein